MFKHRSALLHSGNDRPIHGTTPNAGLPNNQLANSNVATTKLNQPPNRSAWCTSLKSQHAIAGRKKREFWVNKINSTTNPRLLWQSIDESLKARTSEKAGKRRRRRELLKALGPRTSKDREIESRKTRETADLCQKYRVRTTKDRETKARTSEKAGKRRRLENPKRTSDLGPRRTERPRVERSEKSKINLVYLHRTYPRPSRKKSVVIKSSTDDTLAPTFTPAPPGCSFQAFTPLTSEQVSQFIQSASEQIM